MYSIDDTIEEFSKKYAEDPTYATKLANILYINKDTRLSSIEIKELMKAVSKLEDSTLHNQVSKIIDTL